MVSSGLANFVRTSVLRKVEDAGKRPNNEIKYAEPFENMVGFEGDFNRFILHGVALHRPYMQYARRSANPLACGVIQFR